MHAWNRFAALAAMVSTLGAAATARAELVTSAAGLVSPIVVDFSHLGEVQFTTGPVDVSPPGGEAIVWEATTTDEGFVPLVGRIPAGGDPYGLGANGTWTEGRDGFVAVNVDAGTMTLHFASGPVHAAGGLLNYSVPVFGPNPRLEALDAGGNVLESHDLAVEAPISTPGATDAGAFRAIVRAANDIAALRVTNQFAALDDLTLARLGPAAPDGDGDGVPDADDLCPDVADPDQADADGDGIGDACDTADADGDGIEDGADACPLEAGPDADGDGCSDRADDLCALVESSVSHPGIARSLCAKAEAAASAKRPKAARKKLAAFVRQVRAQAGKKIPPATAEVLAAFARNAAQAF